MQTANNYADRTIVRTRLQELGLEASLEEVDRLRQIHSENAIQRALDAAPTNPRTKAFLADLLAKVRKAMEHGLSVSDNRPPRLSPLFALPNFRKAFEGVPVIVGATRPIEHPRVTIHGTHAALRFRAEMSSEGIAVVYVDAARAKGDGAYHWEHKITVMLSPADMLGALGVLIGDVETFGLDHRDRHVGLASRMGDVQMLVGKGKIQHRITLTPADAFNVAAVLLVQIKANTPEGARADALALARRTVIRMHRRNQ